MGSDEGQPSAGSPSTPGTNLSQAWWGFKETVPEEPRGAAGERASFVLHLQLPLGHIIPAPGLAWPGG